MGPWMIGHREPCILMRSDMGQLLRRWTGHRGLPDDPDRM